MVVIFDTYSAQGNASVGAREKLGTYIIILAVHTFTVL